MHVFFRRIHLYLALAAGLIFFVQCLTGTVLVFEEEITHALYPVRYTVAVPTGQPCLSLAELTAHFQQEHPGDKLLGFKVFADPTRTVELGYRDAKAGPEGGPDSKRGEGGPRRGGPGRGPGGPKPGRGSTAFLNPYTGQATATMSESQLPVFKVAENLHRRLLAGKVGEVLSGLSALFILVITTTGLVLWWPKTRQLLTGRLRIKWGASAKRLNHDLHIVLGFYASLFLFGIALTGVIMSYHWATDALFALTGTRPTTALAAPVSAVPGPPDAVAYDAALRTGQQQRPEATCWRVGVPKAEQAAVPVIVPSTLPLRSNGLDTLFVDRASGALLGQHLYARQTAGIQLRRLAKPLHTGEIGGIWTKLLALVVALCGLSFPITGVMLWLNRTRKKK